MKKITLFSLAFILLSFSFYSCSRQTQMSDKDSKAVADDISKLVDKILEYNNKLQIDSSLIYVSNDSNAIFFFEGKGYNYSQASDLLKIAYAERTSQTFTLYKRHFDVISHDCAIMTASGKAEVTEKDGCNDKEYFVETWVWKKIDAKWKITHIHESEMETPESDEMACVESCLSELAKQIEGMELKPEITNVLLKKFIDKCCKIYGSAFAFAPATVDGKTVRSAPYVYRSGKDCIELNLGDTFDYTKSDWYAKPIESKAGYWTDPYYDEFGGKVWMVTYSIAVYKPGTQELVGVVTCDLALD